MARIPPTIPQNLLDKAIAYIAPGVALRRAQQRGALALAGGYTGARMDRAQLASWRTRGGSPESDLSPDLPKLRERSRDLARNVPIATGAVGTTVTHVVGTGLACMPAPNAVHLGLTPEQLAQWQRTTSLRFEAWAASKDSHLERQLDFYAQQGLVFRSVLESGDLCTLTPRVARAGRGAQLALQHIEADRLSNPQGITNDDAMTDGVECAASTGEPVAYHFLRGHPGDNRAIKRQWDRVVARGGATGRLNVLHLFRPTRPGQRRGVPMLAPIIEPLKQIGRYTDAELTAAVTSGLFSVFLRMDPQAFQDLFDDDAQTTMLERSSKWSGEMEAGKVINLLPGEEPVTSNPGRPNQQFDPFTQSILKQIGMALGMPYEVLTMAYQSSYSAARGALLMAWKFFMEHRAWLATNFCQPVYELWLADEIAAGRIQAPGFFADPVTRYAWCTATWVGDGPGSIDPAKEVAAAKERVALGISTLQAESILHDGVAWEVKHAQQVKESAARSAAGLAIAGAALPPPVVAAPPEPDADDKEDDTPPPPTRTEEAFGAIAAAMHAMAAREPAAPTVNVAPAQVSVRAGDVVLPDGLVHLEATLPQQAVHNHVNVEATTVNVEPAAAQVTVVHQQQPMRQIITHADGETTVIRSEPIK